MAGEVNWKAKYRELKAKYMESVDMAFRLGFEQGGQQAQQDQAMQQQQQQAELEQAAAAGMNGGGPDGAPGGPPGAPGKQPQVDDGSGGPTMPAGPGKGIESPEQQDSQHPDGSELDQHIAKLEGMLGKSEELDVNVLKETVNNLKSLQKSFREQIELKKSAAAIPKIAAALHKPKFKLGVQASHNMNSTAKAAVTMQHKIVEDIMEKWESEEKRASSDILSQLNIEGLTKKEE